MTYTRRQLLQKIFNPALWREPDESADGFVLPDGKDIVLREDLCIAWGRGVCDRCESVCDDNAILFVGMMHPRILADRCTLCGDCAPVCPTSAIVLRFPTGPSRKPGETT